MALAEREKTIGDLLKTNQRAMLSVLPKHITPERLSRLALNYLRRNPALMDCSAPSIMNAILKAAQLGLELDDTLGQAYLVPFKGECTLMPGYRGRIELCRRSGQISTIIAEVVHEGDVFDFGLGDEPFINHRPNLQDPDRETRPITFVYAVAKLRDGGVQRVVMSQAQIEAHKKKHSKGYTKSDSPWADPVNWRWMAKKTALIQLCKLLPVSVESQQLFGAEEQYLYGTRNEARVAPATDLNALADRITGTGNGKSIENSPEPSEEELEAAGLNEPKGESMFDKGNPSAVDA